MASSSRSSSLALLLLMVYAVAGALAATNHVVGDNLGWNIPSSPSVYTDWASKQTFAVGDSLLFNFTTGLHDVLQVTKSNYDACGKQSPLKTFATGPATVPIDSTGTLYYICSVGSHCNLGQKMTLTVSSAASSPATPSPPPTSGGPTPPTTPSSPGPSTGAGTPPPNAAPSSGPGKASTAALALTASAAALLLL